jgi:hypothetical protein
MRKKIEDTATFEALLVELEPDIVRSQFKRAVERLHAKLEEDMARDGSQAGRALLEKMALIAGDRRTKTLNVQVERRRP